MAVIASGTGDIGPIDIEKLAEDAQVVLDVLHRGEWELSLLVCDDAFIAPLNQQWRAKEGPTDVLSFPQLEFNPSADTEPSLEPDLLGDVVISATTATRQAQQLGHSTEHELRILLIHGLCHLLGYTHETNESQSRMVALETTCLNALGLPAVGLIERVLH